MPVSAYLVMHVPMYFLATYIICQGSFREIIVWVHLSSDNICCCLKDPTIRGFMVYGFKEQCDVL